MQFPAGGNLWQTRTYHAWNGSSGNGNGRLWEIRIGTSATETANTNYNKLRLGYAYDSYGNIIASSEQFSLGTWYQYRHCYDDQNRLVRGYHQYATTPTTIPSCTGLNSGQIYLYDKAGRLTDYEGFGYSSYDGHAIQKTGYSYDATGNLTSRAGNTLVWDHENRLQEVKSGSTVIESYLYDDNGIRTKRTAGGASTYFPSPYYELAGSTPIKYYFFGGQRVAQKNGSTLYYLHQDHLGSTVLTTGTTDATKTYRAYGNQRAATGSIATRRQFTDQYLDDTGLVYMNARYYDPVLGAFISPDTIVPDASRVFGYNRYMYVAGNPLRLTDSSGHVWETVADAAAISYDVYDIYQNGWSWGRAGTLAVDVAGTAVPFVPAPGACVRWCDDVLQYGDDAASWVGNKASDGWNATKRFFGYGDEAAQYGDEAADAAKVGMDCLTNSFSGDTLVMTAGGAKPIAALVEGDLVLAYNEATGQIEVHPITDTISHIDPEIVLLTIDGETLETTAEHPFYEMESAPWLAVGEFQGRWTDAIALQTGDLVWQADGTTGVVEAVQVVSVQQPMYNLTVAEAHTFFVGDGEWLVHNCIKNVFTGRRSMLNDMVERNVRGADGFTTARNGRQSQTINDQDVLTLINETFGSTRDWVKVYDDGFDAAGNKVSLHYFHNTKSGEVWGGKIKSGWSNQHTGK